MKFSEIYQGLPRLKRKIMTTPVLTTIGILAFLVGEISGAQYFLFRQALSSWDEARLTCMKHGRMLARIRSLDDQQWVEALRPYISSDFWIGLNMPTNSSNYTWLDDSPLTYSKWAHGYPGGQEGLDCVRVRKAAFTWETVNCTNPMNFLCENIYFKKSPRLSDGTRVKGLLMGFGVIGAVLFFGCLLLQLPCCRIRVSDKIAHIGFGKRPDDKKPMF